MVSQNRRDMKRTGKKRSMAALLYRTGSGHLVLWPARKGLKGAGSLCPLFYPSPSSISHAFLWNPEAAPRPVDLPNSLYRFKTLWVGLDLEGK